MFRARPSTCARARVGRPRAPRARRAPRRWAAGTLVALVLTGATCAPAYAVQGRPRAATATDSASTTPLSVVITSLTPGVIPRRGKIRLTGRVANGSHETWTDVNVAPFTSGSPITSREELAQADETDPTATVGSRLDDPGTYAQVGDLPPGTSKSFALTVPVTSLGISGAAGVYWIGVHALGTNVDGRDDVADGRARTFIPLVPAGVARHRSTEVSLVLPLRERARRSADGSLNGPARWGDLTAEGGRLSRLADLAATGSGHPLTWSIDPAVLDALDDLGLGNPPLSLGSSRRAKPSSSPSPSQSPSPSPSASAAGSAKGTSGASGTEKSTSADSSRVLRTFVDAVRGQTLLTLPYADPDAVSLARRKPSLLSRAQDLAQRRMSARDLTGSATVEPPDGLFDPALLSAVRKNTMMLLTDGASSESASRVDPLQQLPTGQPLVLSDALASAGGPAPTASHDALAVRQRVLSDAALELISGQRRHLVVTFPSRWDPGAYWRSAHLFGVLDHQPWLRLTPVGGGGPATYTGTLPYGRTQRAAEVPDADVAAARQLAHTGTVMDHLLANNNDVRDRLVGAALQATAYASRGSGGLAAQQVLDLDATVRDRLRQVQVTGTDPVTLSAASGALTVTLVNGLSQPITLGVRIRTGSTGVKIESTDPVDLGPGERRTLRLQVHSVNGLHDVSMTPVTREGEPVGTPFAFSLRTSQVGEVIWYVMAGGAALLLVMIVRRIVLRVRHRSWRVEEST